MPRPSEPPKAGRSPGRPSVRLPIRLPSLPLLALLAIGMMFGLTANIVKLGTAAGWPPVGFLFWSILLSGILLLFGAGLSGKAPAPRRDYLTYFLIAGLISVALPNSLAFAAVPHIGVSFVALCLAFPPVFTYVLALGFRMERPQARRLAAVLIAVLGVGVLAASKWRGAEVDPLWMLLALLSPALLASGNIYRSLHWPKDAAPLSLAPGMLLAAALLLGLYIWASGGAFWAPPGHKLSLVYMLIQAGLFTGTYALFFYVQQAAGPVFLSQIGPIGAVFGTAVAVSFLDEPLTAALGFALAAVIVSVYLMNRGRA